MSSNLGVAFAEFQHSVSTLDENFGLFEDVCLDLNFTKLVDEVKNKGPSTIQHPDFIDSLTVKAICKDISFYGRKQLKRFESTNITNKEKLLLLYGLYHNYCWKMYDKLYSPVQERSRAGGDLHSQHRLMIQCTDYLDRNRNKDYKIVYERYLSGIETIRDRLHEFKEVFRETSKTLYDDGALYKMTRVVSEDHFNNKYFQSLKFDNNTEFIFKYYSNFEGMNDKSPMDAAHSINIKSLRNIIDTIFKIPRKGRLKKNSDKGKLFRLLLKLLYF